jgi:hypothetical protein
MRLGILLGFLIGAAIASYLASQEAEPESGTPGGGLVEKFKHQAEEARAAARQASDEKQAEMLREWERLRHEEPSDHH